MKNVGYHTNISSLLLKEGKFFEKWDTFQVFLGSPRTFKEPNFTDIQMLMKRNPNLNIVIHSPYVVNLCKGPEAESYNRTLALYIKIAKEMDKIGLKRYVTHIGGRSEDMEVKESIEYIYTFCKKWLLATEGTDVILCLENDSGSKKGTKMGFVKVLELVIRKINSPRVRMTLDTEHAYAAGFDVLNRDNLERLKDVVEVVHWNSIPEEVNFGGHLDRHSTTSFFESKENMSVVYEVFKDSEIPMIFEVNDFKYVRENIEFMRKEGLI